MAEGVFAVARLKRFVRLGDGRRFGLDFPLDRDAIISEIAQNAVDKIILLSTFVITKVKRKDCAAYKGYSENIILRAIANYVAKRFRVPTSNRDRTVRGVIEAMLDQTPFHVIRRDLSSFYETIPLEPVRSRILYDTAIPRGVRHYLREFYDNHCGGGAAGLPRGIGLTTVLVELAMQPFDDAVRAIPGVYRYFRYSDDILIFAYQDPEGVEAGLKAALQKLPGMKFNQRKSDVQAFAGDTNPPGTDTTAPGYAPSRASFEYLGYRFEAEQRIGRKEPRTLWVSIANRKLALMKTRIFLSFKSFEKSGDGSMLVDRIRVLTGNYQVSRKGIASIAKSKYIYAGIFYNYWRSGVYRKGNHQHTTPTGLSDIDKFYHGYLKGKSSPFRAALAANLNPKQASKLSRMSFVRGFAGRRMVRVPFQRFAKIKAVWRNA